MNTNLIDLVRLVHKYVIGKKILLNQVRLCIASRVLSSLQRIIGREESTA